MPEVNMFAQPTPQSDMAPAPACPSRDKRGCPDHITRVVQINTHALGRRLSRFELYHQAWLVP
jgi:hypothetical protein